MTNQEFVDPHGATADGSAPDGLGFLERRESTLAVKFANSRVCRQSMARNRGALRVGQVALSRYVFVVLIVFPDREAARAEVVR